MHMPPVADMLDLQAPRTRLGALLLGPPTPILWWTRNQGTRVGGGGSCERRSVLNLDKFTSGVCVVAAVGVEVESKERREAVGGHFFCPQRETQTIVVRW
jgi:hypothetical protein